MTIGTTLEIFHRGYLTILQKEQIKILQNDDTISVRVYDVSTDSIALRLSKLRKIHHFPSIVATESNGTTATVTLLTQGTLHVPNSTNIINTPVGNSQVKQDILSLVDTCTASANTILHQVALDKIKAASYLAQVNTTKAVLDSLNKKNYTKQPPSSLKVLYYGSIPSGKNFIKLSDGTLGRERRKVSDGLCYQNTIDMNQDYEPFVLKAALYTILKWTPGCVTSTRDIMYSNSYTTIKTCSGPKGPTYTCQATILKTPERIAFEKLALNTATANYNEALRLRREWIPASFTSVCSLCANFNEINCGPGTTCFNKQINDCNITTQNIKTCVIGGGQFTDGKCVAAASTVPIAENCQLSPFTDWSQCDPATKLQSRTQSILKLPRNGGRECPSQLSESRSCVIEDQEKEEIKPETNQIVESNSNNVIIIAIASALSIILLIVLVFRQKLFIRSA